MSDIQLKSPENQTIQKLLQSVASNTQLIVQNIKQIQNMVQQFGTQRDSLELREKSVDLAKKTDELAKITNKQLKELTNYATTINRDKALKTLQERVTEQFFNTLKQFQECQKLSLEKQRSNTLSNLNKIDYNLIDMSSSQDVSFSNNPSRQYQQQQLDEAQLRQVREQNEAMKELEQNIVDVNVIFKDLAVIVHEQGDIIDSIEGNIEEAQLSVRDANTQLTGAVKYQSSARRKKLCLFVIVIVVLAIIALILYLSLRGK